MESAPGYALFYGLLSDSSDQIAKQWEWDREREPGHAYDSFDFRLSMSTAGLGGESNCEPEEDTEVDDQEGGALPLWRQPWPTHRDPEWLALPPEVVKRNTEHGFPVSATDVADMSRCIEEVTFEQMDWTATGFVDPDLPRKLFSAKSWFDDKQKDFYKYRDQTNPYEPVGKNIFLSRAAVKMAELDNAAGILARARRQLRDDAPLLIGDLCSAPGGFTEYLLWAANFQLGNRTAAYSFTISLQPAHDRDIAHIPLYTLQHSPLLRISQRNTWVRVDGQENGDITCADNMRHFLKYSADALSEVHNSNQRRHRDGPTHLPLNSGFLVVVADGGNDVSSDYNKQEFKMKHLVLAQVTTALRCLARGGIFVIKLFDCFSRFSLELVWILRQCFREMSIFKPLASRPANSERYFIGVDYLYTHDQIEPVADQLTRLVVQLAEAVRHGDAYPTQDNVSFNDVTRLLCDTDLLQSDKAFVDYMRQSNDTLGRLQLRALRQIQRQYVPSSRVNADPEQQTAFVAEYLQGIHLRPVPYQLMLGINQQQNSSLWSENEQATGPVTLLA